MPRIQDELGVQSYCFRGFKDNAKVAQLVRECELSAIELCAVHVDFNDTASHQQVIDTYKDAGVAIRSIGVQPLSDDEAAMRNYLEFAKAAGSTVVSCNFGPGLSESALRTAAGLAAEYDIRFAIHNHGGKHWLGNGECLNHQFSLAAARGDDRLGLCLDTAWALDARENPVKIADRFKKRLFGIHIKDFVFDRAGKPEDVVVGTGNLDLPEFIRTVQANGFDGACVLEYEGDVDNPVPALKQCVEAVAAAS